jgi:hypothetical protein
MRDDQSEQGQGRNRKAQAPNECVWTHNIGMPNQKARINYAYFETVVGCVWARNHGSLGLNSWDSPWYFFGKEVHHAILFDVSHVGIVLQGVELTDWNLHGNSVRSFESPDVARGHSSLKVWHRNPTFVTNNHINRVTVIIIVNLKTSSIGLRL